MRMLLAGFIAGVASVGYISAMPLWLVMLSVSLLILCIALLYLRVAPRFIQPSPSVHQKIVHHTAWLRMVLSIIGVLLSVVFGAGYAGWQLDQALDTRLTEPQQRTARVKVIGISDGVGDQWRQVVQVLDAPQAQESQDTRWLIYATADWNPAQKNPPATLVPAMLPGQIWQVQVKLKPAHSTASPGAFDVEKWLLQQHISATGTLQQAQLLADKQPLSVAVAVQRERLRIRDHISQLNNTAPDLSQQSAKGVLLGLLTGDRSMIDAPTTLLYQKMGISHLLAISGPHVILAALMLSWLLQKMLDRFPFMYSRMERPRWLLPFFLLIVVAYAVLAGFDIPAQRTVFMVILTTVLWWWRRRWPASRILLVAASVLLLLDPLAVLSAAFWLSFGAVAILLSMNQLSTLNVALEAAEHPASRLHQARQTLIQFIGLQWRLFVLLSPLVLLCFAKLSWLSPLVNLLAIPLLSLIILPLNLFAYAVFQVYPPLADLIWQVALGLLCYFHQGLNALAGWFPAALQPMQLSRLQLISLFAALMLLLLPKGLLPKWWLAFLLIPVFYPARSSAPLMIQVLDVGQGLSVLIKTSQHAMLVDTGAKLFNGSDMGEKVVMPALRAQGITRLDQLMLTHLDNDHSGGADHILAQLPVTRLSSSEPFGQHPTYLCEAGQQWQWDGILFRTLSPLPAHRRNAALNPKLSTKNERSCVLMVELPAQGQLAAQRVLIMGDAGLYTEFLMLQQQRDLKADLLIVGHHGSAHSSSTPFLQAVQPQRAVISAGYLNRYQHPAAIVLARLQQQGIAIDSTISSGTLTYELGQHAEIQPLRYRNQTRWLQRLDESTNTVESD